MAHPFTTAAILYHCTLGALAIGLLLRVRRRLAQGVWPGLSWRDSLGFALATPVLAAVAAALGFGHPLGFGWMRFVAQALFGEAVVLAVALSVLHRRPGRSPRWAASFAAASLVLLGVYWEAYHREPRALQVSRHHVDLGAGGEAGRGLRIVHLTDLQTHAIGSYEDRALREAMAQQPDLIVITGDFIQPRLAPTRTQATADLKRLLQRRPLRAPLGVYAVRGDVDLDWPGVLEGTGIQPLTGEIVRVPLPGATLSLVGLTIRMSRGQADPALLALMERVPAGDVRVVLGHNPNFVRTLAAHDVAVDLALAGHTHGGQVVLPFVGPPITKTRLPGRYASGLTSYEGIPLHVSRGIGMERGAAPQIRFLCPPEICVLDVRYGVNGAGRRASTERPSGLRRARSAAALPFDTGGSRGTAAAPLSLLR